MRLMPRDPFCQIATKAPRPTTIERPAQASAPKKVASAGLISRKPKRTMMIETSTATAENTPRLRAHDARLDTFTDWKGAKNLRAILEVSYMDRVGGWVRKRQPAAPLT